MESLKSLLNIETIVSRPDVDGELSRIANILMNEYCIDNGAHQYRPIEIEFYIYDKDKHADEHVYKRDKKNAGVLFYHYSGMDICLGSCLDKGQFGGILIRALEREDGLMFGGPLVCLNEVLNTATTKCHVARAQVVQNYSLQPALPRVGITPKNESDNYKYRFIRCRVPNPIEMNFPDYDFKKKERKNRKGKYKF